MKRNVLLYLLVSSLLSIAQNGPDRQMKLDSLTELFRQDSIYIYRFRKCRPYLNYHERNSLANPKIVNFFGPQIGCVLYERHIVGIGGYLSTRKTKLPFISYDQNAEVRKNIEIRYLTVFYQYILINRRYFEIHLPVEYGHGKFYSDFRDLSGNRYKTAVNDFNLWAGGVQLVLKPVRWIGISNNIGYRFANERIVDGYYYSIGVWLGFKPILTDLNYYLKRKRYRAARAALMAG